MDKKENLSEILKIRCTKTEKDALTKLATERGLPLSVIARSILNGSASLDPDTLAIRQNLVYCRLLNKLDSLPFTRSQKEEIRKELFDLA